MAVAPGERRSGHSNRVRYELQAQSAAQSAYLSLSRCEVVTEFHEACDVSELHLPGLGWGLWSRGRLASVSRFLLGHGFGAKPAPCGSSLFCFDCVARWVTVSVQILFAKYDEKISPEPP